MAAQTTAPPRRAHHGMVYDERRGQVLLTGGSTPLDGGQRFDIFNDLWAWSGTGWQALPASGDPISSFRLAWDAARGQVVSFGGYPDRLAGAFRALGPDGWRTLASPPEYSAVEPSIAFDRARGRLVAFGGSVGRDRTFGATWEYDGAQWTRVDLPGPPGRSVAAMTFDEAHNQVVLYGGAGPSGPLSDTWVYDGRSWRQLDVTGPGPRHSAGVAYDSRRGVVLLFGGLNADGFVGDTWAWDGTAWRKVAETGPEPRGMGYMAYDKRRDRVVLFGGRKGWPDGDLNDTWEWDGTAWKRVGG